MTRWWLGGILIAAFSFNLAPAQTGGDGPTAVPASELLRLDQLAAASDLVALVQVVETKYEYRRGFPISGSGYLRVILPYKADQRYSLIEVSEEGINNSCYFPTTAMWDEGQRFLVFLSHDDDEVPDYRNPDPDQDPAYHGLRFRSHSATCALPVLVTENNQYAIRYPLDSIAWDEAALAAVQEMNFTDPDAHVPTEDMTRTAVAGFSERYAARQQGDSLVYTKGVYLSDVRRLMGPDAVTLDRTVR